MLGQVHFIPHCLANISFSSQYEFSFTGIMQMQGMTHYTMNLNP